MHGAVYQGGVTEWSLAPKGYRRLEPVSDYREVRSPSSDDSALIGFPQQRVETLFVLPHVVPPVLVVDYGHGASARHEFDVGEARIVRGAVQRARDARQRTHEFQDRSLPG